MSVMLTFVRAGTTFEPAQVSALCQAYDKVCATLKVENGSLMLKQALASEIVALASQGRWDAEFLWETTLARIARGH